MGDSKNVSLFADSIMRSPVTVKERKLEKFLLLTWKNWLLQWRHPVQTLVEILAPVLFSALLVVIRSLVDPEEHSQIIYDRYPVALTINQNNTLSTIAWSPWNPELEKIMNWTASSLQLKHRAFNSSKTLAAYLLDSINILTTLAGVQFDDALSTAQELPKNIEVTFRFPGELRSTVLSGLGQTWKSHLLFPIYQMAGPRGMNDTEGAQPGYSKEGFLALQHAVSYSIIKYLKNGVMEIPKIWMSRFPYPSWMYDPLLMALQSFVGLIIMLSFAYTCINTVKVITTEKERQLKEAMKIMGLPNWLHWTAWFIKSFTFLLITVILMVILLKIQWYPGTEFSVFTLSNAVVIFVFLILYVCATVTFCFAISVFFSKANTAATVAGMIWFFSYAPYTFMRDKYDKLGFSEKMFASLCSNTAMAFGFQLILMFEGIGEGVQWNNIWRTTTPDDNITLGHVMIMLIIDCVLYLFIALYVEAIFPGDYGVPQVWYYPFTYSYWCGQPRYVGVEDMQDNSTENNNLYEKEPTNLSIGVQIKHLKKVFSNKKVAVRDLSLNMYEGQITVLLGHNGAGKTTTMCMLTGMFPPTSGTAIVGGHDICTDMNGVRASLGLCPQHNILFDELTVAEHLYFFSKLKGLAKDEINNEINKYVGLLELVPKAHAKASSLSGGMKRKLSVGVALCGNSKIVMCDEPTAGMDPAARRALWDLLQSQKKDRTILLTTHFMDEADLLGDRIAIMAGGQLQCCGSSFFLKKKYGAGYHLIMDKTSNCNVQEVTNVLQKHLPNIKVESVVGSELIYLLHEEHSSVFEEMLSDLENNSEALGIQSYGISLTTLEEVFMKVGADRGQEEANDALDLNHTQKIEEVNMQNGSGERHQSAINETILAMGSFPLRTGWDLRKNQFFAMMMKRVLSTIRSWILLLIQILIPVAFLVIAIFVVRGWDIHRDSPKLTFKLNAYNNPVTVLNGSSNNVYYDKYIDILRNGQNIYTDWKGNDLSTNMLQETAVHTSTVRLRYIVGATFHDDRSITAWFNNQPYHSPPLALGMVMNSILHQEVDPSYNIQISNHPLPFTLNTQFTRLARGQNMGFQVAFNIGFSMTFVSSFYVLFYVRERVSKAKHLQFVSGVEIITFWATSFLWDLITFIFTSLCLIGTLAIFQEDGFKTFDDFARLFSVLLYFGFAMLPMMYIASNFFEIPSSGYTRMTLINIFTGVAAFLVVQVLASDELDLKHVANTLHWIFLLIPHYSLSTGIRDVNLIYATYDLCHTMVDSCVNINIPGFPPLTPEQCWEQLCKVQSQCCNVKKDYYAWKPNGIGRNVVFSLLIGFFLIILLLLNEYRMFDKLKYAIQRLKIPPPVQDDAVKDSDVLEEKMKIRNASIEDINNYNLVLRDVTKYYNKFLAVNSISLGVSGFECFGLLGVNGAGKTSTFKMMTGDEPISRGDAWVKGLNLKKQMKGVHKFIGYCPQFDALLDDLTGRETLIMFGLLRGFAFDDCNFIAEILAKEFDFYRHLDKQVKAYSGGNKRKLSTTVALIGDPPVLYLDEPTTGMDPATKRYLWNALCKVRDNGKCIILTSHSMEECEALCTRLAIMVNGNFKCLGSTQHLKSKFSEGYTLTIKLHKMGDTSLLENIEPVHIDTFVKDNFPGAIPRERHQELLTYYIASKSLPWSKMFGIMEKGKKKLNIEDYSLGQSSLEQVFLTFTKLQRDE